MSRSTLSPAAAPGNINEERPDLVKKYRDLLEKHFREHLAVARDFPREDPLSLGNDQLEPLRFLGYLE